MATISVTIPDDLVDEFLTGFLKTVPIPVELDTNKPIMTKKEWIKESILRWLKRNYKQGKVTLTQEEAVNQIVWKNLIS